MSYVTKLYMNRQIKSAAEALDLIDAAKNAKLKKDAGKFKLLATVMKEAVQRFYDLANMQGVMTADEFYQKALERLREEQHERALLAKMRREKREANERARAEFLALEQGMIAA